MLDRIKEFGQVVGGVDDHRCIGRKPDRGIEGTEIRRKPANDIDYEVDDFLVIPATVRLIFRTFSLKALAAAFTVFFRLAASLSTDRIRVVDGKT